MPKLILSDFTGGLAKSDRAGQLNQFYIGRGLDVYGRPGYMQPGWGSADISVTGLTSADYAFEMIEDPVSAYVYIFGSNSKAMIVDGFSDTSVADTDGSANASVTVTNMSSGKAIIYSAKDNTTVKQFIFLVYGTEIARILANQANPYSATNLKKTFLNFAGFTPLSGGTAGFDVIDFQGFLFFTNGQYVARYNGNGTGNYGDFTEKYFDLGVGWSAYSLFTTNNYVGICARDGNGNSRAYLIDGNSGTAAVKIIPMEKLSVKFSKNRNGNIFIGASKNDKQGEVIGVLNDNGFSEIAELKTEVSGTLKYLTGGTPNTIDSLDDNFIFGIGNGNSTVGLDLVYAVDKDLKLTMPLRGGATTTTNLIKSLKVISSNKVYMSRLDSTYKFSKLTRGTYSVAQYGGIYQDFGQKVRINYIKFFFRPLVSGDSITPTLDTNYGTSNTLKDPNQNTTISFTNDGAVTQKKFKTRVDCHVFRPVLSWTAGGTPFSKIEIDFTPIEDV